MRDFTFYTPTKVFFFYTLIKRDSNGAVVNDSPVDCQSREGLFRRKANP